MNQSLIRRKPPKIEYNCPPIRKEQEKKHCQIVQIMKNITLYDLIEEWMEMKDPHFMEYLMEKIKEKQTIPNKQERKKWDIPTNRSI